MKEKRERRRKAPRQRWKPNFCARVLYRAWRIALSVLKVVAGAVATVALIGVICAFVFVNFLGDYLQEDVMTKAEMSLEDYELDKTSYIYCLDEKGDIQILQQIYSTTDRRWASFEELPEALIEACVAIEDKRFYEHQGVDWITTVKACLNMFMGGSSSFGGSTVTQQLIKNLKLEQNDESADDVTVQRKVLEIFRAQAFERKYDKKVVMEWYMNTVYFGQGCNGVKSAAENYFGKELQDMTTAECAALIGITNNPSMFNPYSTKIYQYDGQETDGAGRNRIRQKKILTAMRDQGFLEEDVYLEAYHQELVFKRGIAEQDKWAYCKDVYNDKGELVSQGCGYNCAVRDLNVQETDGKKVYSCPNCSKLIDVAKDASQSVYSWYVDQVLEDVGKAMAARDEVPWNKETREIYMQRIGHGGYHIYTPYDPTVQEAVDKIYTDLEQIPTVRNGQQLQSAIVIIDNRTGDIVAMAGGVGEKEVFDAYNRATDAKLQTGSSIKPLTVYAPAFELGLVNPSTVIDDMPISFNNKNPFPRNDNNQYHYTRTVWRGIVSSVNAITVNTLDMIGTQYSFNFAKDKFGISTLVESYKTSSGTILSDIGYSPLGMGALTFGATVRDMTSAYGTFANNGTYREGRTFTKVYDSEGNLVLENEQDSRKILSEKTVNYMNYCLDSAVASGTGTAADLYRELGIDVAGKTGSTQNFKDRYFVGFTGYYTAAVWCGFDIPEQITLTGVFTNPAARLWKKVMRQLHVGKETIPLYDTSEMIQVSVCLDSGKLATSECYNDIRDTLERVQAGIWVYPEDAPKQTCDKHISLEYCVEGKSMANEWCKKFHKVGQIEFSEKSLVKMTQARIDALMAVSGKGIRSAYLQNDYVYLVDAYGNPQDFYGFKNNINKGVNSPYECCKVHTQAAWEKFKQENPWVPDDI